MQAVCRMLAAACPRRRVQLPVARFTAVDITGQLETSHVSSCKGPLI